MEEDPVQDGIPAQSGVRACPCRGLADRRCVAAGRTSYPGPADVVREAKHIAGERQPASGHRHNDAAHPRCVGCGDGDRIPVGILMASGRVFNGILRDLVLFFMALPLVIWALLGVLWFGGSLMAPIVAGAAVAFPFTAVNVYEGVAAVDRDMLRWPACTGCRSWWSCARS